MGKLSQQQVRVRIGLMVSAALAVLTARAPAQQTFYWTGNPDSGDLSGSLSRGDNWTDTAGNPGPPGARDLAYFAEPGTYTIRGDGLRTRRTYLDIGMVTLEDSHASGALRLGDGGPATLQLAADSELTVDEPASGAILFVGTLGEGRLFLEPESRLSVSSGGTIIGESAVGWFRVKELASAQLEGPKEGVASVIFGLDEGVEGRGVIEGDGATLKVSRSSVEIGRSGLGRLDVTSGGRVEITGTTDAAATLLGTRSSSRGTIVVDGDQSRLKISGGGIEIGRGGRGEFWITGGAGVEVGGDEITSTVLGTQAGGDGLLVLEGQNSRLRLLSGDLEIGRRGKGRVDLLTGAALSAPDPLLVSLGTEESGDGTLYLEGAKTQARWVRRLVVGDRGKGRFHLNGTTEGFVLSGGSPIDPALTVGRERSASGGVLVEEAWLTIINGGAVTVGAHGEGSLVLSEKGHLWMQPQLNFGGHLSVASAAGSSGRIEVSGTEAFVDAMGSRLDVGSGGAGRVLIQNQGRIFVREAQIGSGGTGEVRVEGQGFLQVAPGGELRIGQSSQGSLILDGGGLMSPGLVSATLGVESAGAGVLTLARTTLLLNNLTVGAAGTGTLTVGEDAELGIAEITLGAQAGSSGTLFLDNGGDLNIAGRIRVAPESGGAGQLTLLGSFQINHLEVGPRGRLDTRSRGTGDKKAGTVDVLGGQAVLSDGFTTTLQHLRLRGGATVHCSGSLTLTNSLHIDRSTLVIGEFGEVGGGMSSFTRGALTLQPGFHFSSSGIIYGQVINKGVMWVGNSPGLLDIAGTFTQATDGVLTFTVAGIRPDLDHSRLRADEVTLGGTLILDFQRGFAPKAGQRFELIQSTGAPPVLDRVRVEVKNLQPGFQYELSTTAEGGLHLVAVTDGQPVTEPSLRLQWQPGGILHAEFSGILQESSDLRQWVDSPGAPTSPLRLYPPDQLSHRFFRVRGY